MAFKSTHTMQLATLVLVTIPFLSCTQNDNTPKAFRDSVLNNYFALVDSSGKFDTAEINFKLLKAYHHNDTSYLKKVDSYIKEQYSKRANWDLWQSDIPLQGLNALNSQEAMRFVFSLYGGPTFEAITLTKTDTDFKLHYLCYFHNKDSATFHKRKEIFKIVKAENWQEIADKIKYADFWGLKTENDRRGLDGNDLTVMVYQKSDYLERYHVVHRWGNSPLDDVFYYIYYNLLNNSERLYSTDASAQPSP